MSLLIYYVIVDKVVIARLVIVICVTIGVVCIEEQFFIVLCLCFDHRAFIVAASLDSSGALFKRALNIWYVITDKIFSILLGGRLWRFSTQTPLLVLIYLPPLL